MEDSERLWDNGIFWGFGPFGVAPNGMGYGSPIYPSIAPFFGFGLEPNLWANANLTNDNNYKNPVMRDYMNANMENVLKPIEMLYPKCYKMMYDVVCRECNMFLRKNSNIMQNKISKEEFCKMVQNCQKCIMDDEESFIDSMKMKYICDRDIDSDENEVESRNNFGNYGNLFVNSMLAVLLIQELRRRGCMYCY